MRILPLLAASLALCASAQAGLPALRFERVNYKVAADGIPAETMSPARRAELSDLLGRWRETKRKARAMIDELHDAYRGDPQQAKIVAWTDKFWGLVQLADAKVHEKTDEALKLIPESEKARREALEKLTLARLTRLYGNIAPRVLDELVKDPSGRRFAREFIPSWALALSEAEADALEAELKAATGLPADALGRFPEQD